MKRFITLFAPEPDNGGGGGAEQQDNGNLVPEFDFRTALDEKGAFKPGWDAALPADLRDYAGTLGKYPTLTEMMRGHGNMAKMLSQRQALKPPAPDAKPEEIAAWNKAMGVPEKPEDYGLKAPEKMPEGVEWDAGLATGFQAVAHKIGLTPAQVNGVMEFHLQQQVAAVGKHKGLVEAHQKQQQEALAKEWGAEFTEKMARTEAAAGLLGAPANWKESPEMVKMLHEASGLIREDKLVGADKVGLNFTGPQQAEDIRRNPNNPWYKAYRGEEGIERQQEASKLMMRLHGVKE